jgi:excisionase family DNA binding protein
MAIDAQLRYLSIDEAAAYLNVSIRFMRRLVADRRLRHFKVGKFLRFCPGDLDAFVAAGEVPCADQPFEGIPWPTLRRLAS